MVGKKDKRKLVGMLALVAVTTGVLFGTGAFTQVEAERQVDVAVADDSDAFLGITAIDESYTDTNSGNAGQNVVTVDLTGANSGPDPTGDGINDDAVTTIDGVINITNQGTQTVELNVSSAPEGVNLTASPSLPTSVDQGNNVTLGVNVSTDPSRPISGGTIDSSTLNDNIIINAKAP